MIRLTSLSTVTAVMVSVLSAGLAFAEAKLQPVPDPISTPNAVGVTNVSDHHHHYHGGGYGSGYCASCQGHGHGHGHGHYGGTYSPRSCPQCGQKSSNFWLFGLHQKYPADYGFNVPVPYPIEETPVQYWRYHPSAFYGEPGSVYPAVLPVVATPTDTTQLGYYYQRVPTWNQVPGMIPPPPNPAYYHQRACPMGSMCYPPYNLQVVPGTSPTMAPAKANSNPPAAPPQLEGPGPNASNSSAYPKLLPVSN
ncbi:hypothetical protein [Calycomorphotria hydatis]|uniref:Uncharacterized protein n=1 Tax=Calycomorphotria hydatis TaxID=2528027 RepID=A0A517TCF5_9PLAN|nr:hypothetical protein [Calycomorphotria hydatis]QDT66065.1 hypothetical protein V22_33290 [Calycomorphotria hydatis]